MTHEQTPPRRDVTPMERQAMSTCRRHVTPTESPDIDRASRDLVDLELASIPVCCLCRGPILDRAVWQRVHRKGQPLYRPCCSACASSIGGPADPCEVCGLEVVHTDAERTKRRSRPSALRMTHQLPRGTETPSGPRPARSAARPDSE